MTLATTPNWTASCGPRLEAQDTVGQVLRGRRQPDPLIIELPKGGYRPVFRPRLALQVKERLGPVGPGGSQLWWGGRCRRWRDLVEDANESRPFYRRCFAAREPWSRSGSDYFADGLTDEIIRNLSVIDGLTVPSRTSSFALKGKSLNPRETGKRLGADYLVEGSVSTPATSCESMSRWSGLSTTIGSGQGDSIAS